MAALRHALARLWTERARVALHQRDGLEVVREDARREQTAMLPPSTTACRNGRLGMAYPSHTRVRLD